MGWRRLDNLYNKIVPVHEQPDVTILRSPTMGKFHQKGLLADVARHLLHYQFYHPPDEGWRNLLAIDTNLGRPIKDHVCITGQSWIGVPLMTVRPALLVNMYVSVT